MKYWFFKNRILISWFIGTPSSKSLHQYHQRKSFEKPKVLSSSKAKAKPSAYLTDSFARPKPHPMIRSWTTHPSGGFAILAKMRMEKVNQRWSLWWFTMARIRKQSSKKQIQDATAHLRHLKLLPKTGPPQTQGPKALSIYAKPRQLSWGIQGVQSPNAPFCRKQPALCRNYWPLKLPTTLLVGGWTNPSEK